MKRFAFASVLLLAAPALAQQPAPQPIPVPQDVLQRISVYLQEGGSHNEGFALNKAIMDSLQLSQKTQELQAVTKERDDLKTKDTPANAAPPAPKAVP